MSFNSINMFFSNKKPANNIHQTTDCNTVEQSTNFKDLAIYMSEDCTFSSQIVYASNVANR